MNCRSCSIIFSPILSVYLWDYKKDRGERMSFSSYTQLYETMNNQHSSSSKNIFCVSASAVVECFITQIIWLWYTHTFVTSIYIQTHTLFAHHRYYHVIKIHSLNILHVENIFRLKKSFVIACVRASECFV